MNYIPHTVLVERYITPSKIEIDVKPISPSLTITDTHEKIIRLAAWGVTIAEVVRQLHMGIRQAELAFEKLTGAGHLRREWKRRENDVKHAYVYFATQTSEVIQ